MLSDINYSLDAMLSLSVFGFVSSVIIDKCDRYKVTTPENVEFYKVENNKLPVRDIRNTHAVSRRTHKTSFPVA
jgi:hypothetical protein